MNEVIARTIRHVGTERHPAKLTKNGFIENIEVIRRRARKEIEEGAVTASYKADRNAVVSLLNEALASELTNMLQYRRHSFMAKGIEAKSLATEFLEHANEELAHADALAKRIVQLGGEPDFSPAQLAERSHSEYVSGESLLEMLHEDLVAERIAIDTYRQMIRYVGDDDPTTRRVLEDILAQEEEHADELATVLHGLEK